MESEAVSLLRARAVELERELDDTRARLKALLEEQRQVDAGLRAMTGVLISTNGAEASRNAIIHHAKLANADADKRTIKQLVMEALHGHFIGGATANELLDYFAREYGRDDIARTSLSPQLSRLKDERKIRREGRVWRIKQDDFDMLLGDDGDDLRDENGEAFAEPEDGNEGAATPSIPKFDL